MVTGAHEERLGGMPSLRMNRRLEAGVSGTQSGRGGGNEEVSSWLLERELFALDACFLQYTTRADRRSLAPNGGRQFKRGPKR